MPELAKPARELLLCGEGVGEVFERRYEIEDRRGSWPLDEARPPIGMDEDEERDEAVEEMERLDLEPETLVGRKGRPYPIEP